MSWTDEKVEKLKELWTKGHTASQIAEVLGDTTRNAVIGKAHRLSLEARAPSKKAGATLSRDNKQVKRIPVSTKKVLNHLRYFLTNFMIYYIIVMLKFY